MQEVYEFLKKCGTYYLATDENGQPRVRPFGTIDIFNNKLYILTGKDKNVSKQIFLNPKIEICALDDDRWLRVQAIAASDESREAKQHMLDLYPFLKQLYSADDENTQMFYLTSVVATISSFEGVQSVKEF